MADPIDRASDRETADREAAITAHATRPRAEQSAKHCVDCGIEIPANRRAALVGVQTCIDCQTKRERHQKLHRGKHD